MIQQSTKPIIRVSNEDNTRAYGYQWWLYKPPFNFNTVVYAQGFAGQNIFIIKEFDLVIVTTGTIGVNPTKSLSLMFDILTSNNACKQKIMCFYKKIESENYELRQFETDELMSLSQALILYNRNNEAIEFLTKYRNELSNNLYYEFYLGEAYFKTGLFAKAKNHLDKLKDEQLRKLWHLKPYLKKTEKMLSSINESSGSS